MSPCSISLHLSLPFSLFIFLTIPRCHVPGGTPEQMAAAVEEFRDENSGDPSVTCQSVKDANLRTCLHFAAVHGNGPNCGYIFKFCGKYVFILACSILYHRWRLSLGGVV